MEQLDAAKVCVGIDITGRIPGTPELGQITQVGVVAIVFLTKLKPHIFFPSADPHLTESARSSPQRLSIHCRKEPRIFLLLTSRRLGSIS